MNPLSFVTILVNFFPLHLNHFYWIIISSLLEFLFLYRTTGSKNKTSVTCVYICLVLHAVIMNVVSIVKLCNM